MILKLRNDRLILGSPRTSLTSQVNASETSLNVLSIVGFTGSNKYLLVGEFGGEESEIVTFSSSTGFTISSGTLVFDHPIGTPVYLIEANQIDFQRATSVDGSYSSLDIIDVQADRIYTYFEDTVNTTGFAKARFYNESDSSYYREFQEIVRYDENQRQTRGFTKFMATKSMGVEGQIDEDILNGWVTEADDKIRNERNSWPEEIAQLSILMEKGITKYDVSTYLKNIQSPEGLKCVRLGELEVEPLTRDIFYNVVSDAVSTTLAVAISATTDTEIYLTDSSEFADSGTILIEGDEITYTANDRTTGELSGVENIDSTHAITSTAGRDMEVWQGMSKGKPKYISVIDGVLQTYPVIAEDDDVRYLKLDYTKTYTPITLDSDELLFPGFLYTEYLIYKISQHRGDADQESRKNDFLRDLNKYSAGVANATEQSLKPRQRLYSYNRNIRYRNFREIN